MHVSAAFVLAAILKCWLCANLYRLPPPFVEDGRGSSGIGRCKSIGLTEDILLQAEAVDSNRSRPKFPQKKVESYIQAGNGFGGIWRSFSGAAYWMGCNSCLEVASPLAKPASTQSQ